jgi:hypothetical protein
LCAGSSAQPQHREQARQRAMRAHCQSRSGAEMLWLPITPLSSQPRPGSADPNSDGRNVLAQSESHVQRAAVKSQTENPRIRVLRRRPGGLVARVRETRKSRHSSPQRKLESELLPFLRADVAPGPFSCRSPAALGFELKPRSRVAALLGDRGHDPSSHLPRAFQSIRAHCHRRGGGLATCGVRRRALGLPLARQLLCRKLGTRQGGISSAGVMVQLSVSAGLLRFNT